MFVTLCSVWAYLHSVVLNSSQFTNQNHQYHLSRFTISDKAVQTVRSLQFPSKPSPSGKVSVPSRQPEVSLHQTRVRGKLTLHVVSPLSWVSRL